MNMTNHEMSALIEDGMLDAQLSEITLKIAAGELPDEWVVGPKSKLANLCDCLVKHGFEEQANESLYGSVSFRKKW